MDNLTLEECYKILNLSSEATLEDIEASYYKLIGDKLKTNNKQDLVDLKQAHSQLIEYYQNNEEKKLKRKKPLSIFFREDD